MPWIGECPECGKRVNVGRDDRVRRHGFTSHQVDSKPCKGTGRLAIPESVRWTETGRLEAPAR